MGGPQGRLFRCVNVIMLILVNATPGWRVLPFLTEDFVSLLWLVNLSIFASAMVNVAYLAYDAAWFKSVGQIGVTAIGLVASIRMWRLVRLRRTAGGGDPVRARRPRDQPWRSVTDPPSVRSSGVRPTKVS